MSNEAAAGLRTTVATVPACRSTSDCRACGAREARRAELRLEVRAALADEHGRVRRLADDAGELAEVDALVPPARDEHDRRGERAQRGDDRVRLRPLRVVDEPDVADERDRLEPVLDARERGRFAADG